jgi:zinc and cadmium transporter
VAREAIAFALAISAASFLYIAIADLLPTLRARMASSALQFILILAGIAAIASLQLGSHE